MSQTNATEAVNKEEENVIKENVLPDKEPSNVEEVVVVDVEELLKNGRRNLFCKEIQLAVNQLQEACSILSKKHGELGFECASAYYDYGLALLELSRMENGVLGNALQGITEEVGTENDDKEEEEEEEEEEDKGDDGGDSDGKKRKKERSVDEEFVEEDGTTEEEKEKISDQILDAMVDKEEASAGKNKEEEDGEKMEEAASTTAAVAEDGEKIKEENESNEVTSKVESDDKPVEDTADGKKEEDEDAMEADGDGGEEEDGGDDGEEKADDEEDGKGDDGDEKQDNVSQTEDVSNLQLAWEMIELSKTIYKKRQESEVEDKTASSSSMDAKELILKQADCYMKLGEIGVESEMYTQAIEDFQTSYDLLLSVSVAPDDRRLAEVKYQLGLASVYATNYEGAVQNFEDALAIIEVRIKNFENRLKDLGEVGAGDGDKKGDGEKVGGGDDKDGGEGKEEGVKEIIEEIEELKSLVPDIKMKIEDAVEERKSMLSLKDAVKDDLVASVDKKKESESSECIGFSEAKNKSSDEQPAADDITHLVRKKRKQQDTELSEEDTNKKLKVEPVVIGNETDGPIPVVMDGKDDVTPCNGFHDDKENDKKVSNKIEEDMDVEKKTAVVDTDDENNSSTKTTSTTTTTVTAAEQLAN